MAVTFNYRPHPAQLAMHAGRQHRFRTVCCGRRFSKILCLAGELLDRGGGDQAGDYGWIAPPDNVAERNITGTSFRPCQLCLAYTISHDAL